MMLLLSGILSLIVAHVNPSSLKTRAPDNLCVIRNTLCDPNLSHPCCNHKDICKQIEPNAFKCIENVGLGKFCELDEDCDEIWHSKCSKEKTCICRTNNIKVNETACAPVLGGFCWKNELCATDNAVCIGSECQCNVSNYRRFNDRCILNTLGAPCDRDENCDRVRFAKCSKHKVCSCSSNTSAVNQLHCASLIGGFCWTKNDCLPSNSICVNNSCKCRDLYVSRSNNQCIPARFTTMACSTDKECSSWVPHSRCSRNICTCDIDYSVNYEGTCASLINIHCSSNSPCTLDNSLCTDNMCQCKPKFVYHSSKCIAPYLNGPCRNNNDCDQIQNARCSADNVCVCDENYTQFNERICRPVPKEYCLEDNDCQAINSTCIMNECQCKPHFVKQSRNLCALSQLGIDCEDNDDCIEILYSKCSVNKKCECMSNYAEYNITACGPLLGSYCSENQLCVTVDSICSNNICVCGDGLIEHSNNKCTSHFIGKYCMIDKDCKEILGSKCVNNGCACKDNYGILNITACAPLLGEYCINKQQPVSLGKICSKDDDCDVGLKNTVCSIDNTCVCRENYYALNRFKCVPFLNEYCLNNNECGFNSSVCVENKCQCKHNFQSVSKSQCKPIDYMYVCNEDLDCGDPWHIKCSADRKCRCNSNNISINRSTCLPLLKGYCWRNSQCFVPNSACIDYRCKCKHNFMPVSVNLCLPV